MAQKFRNYCYTLNNYSEEELKELQQIECKYHIMGKEKGEQGTPHIQGFISLKNARSFQAFRKLMRRWHLEPCKGSPKQNIEYCRKGGDTIEYGDRPEQGKRNDIEDAKQMALNGRPMKEIIQVTNSYQAIRYAETIKKYFDKERHHKTFVYWFYGPTGSGKSRLAEEMFPGAYWCMESSKWWEGYDGHKVVIINDYRKDFCKFRTLLNLLDRYPYRIECKGGSRQFTAETIVITTPYSIEETWQNRTSEDLEQLKRRVEVSLYFGTGTGTEVVGNTNSTPSFTTY